MSQRQPNIQNHLCRPTTRSSARRNFDRVVAVTNSNNNNTIVNPTAQTAHGVGLVITSAQTAGAAGVDTALTWQSPRYNTDSWWAAGSPTKVTVTLAGLYVITCNVCITVPHGAAVKNDLAILKLKKNGSTATYELQSIQVLVNAYADNATDANNMISMSGIVSLAANDYVETILNTAIGGETIVVGVAGSNFVTTFDVAILGQS